MDGFGVPGLNSNSSAAGTSCAQGIVGPPTTGGLAGFDFGGTGGFTPFGDGLNIGRCNCPLTESEQQFQFVNNWTRIARQPLDQVRRRHPLRHEPARAERCKPHRYCCTSTQETRLNSGAGGLSFATFLLGDVTSFETVRQHQLDRCRTPEAMVLLRAGFLAHFPQIHDDLRPTLGNLLPGVRKWQRITVDLQIWTRA